MRNKSKRYLAALLALLIGITYMPAFSMAAGGINVFAENEPQSSAPAVNEEQQDPALETNEENQESSGIVEELKKPETIKPGTEVLKQEKKEGGSDKEKAPNPDNLKGSVSPDKVKINYDLYPETDFKFEKSKFRLFFRGPKANDPPIIGTDHPENPGEVMLFKEATPVDGMVNTWDITLRMEAKDTNKTTDIVLVIDRSGSMAGSRMTAAKEAANQFVDELLPSDTTRIGVVSFASDVSVNQGLTNNQTDLENAIEGLYAYGGTFTQAGIRQANALLSNSTADYKHIVLLSDGEPTYNYRINNPSNYLIDGGPGYHPYEKQTSTDVPESAFSSVRTGAGNSMWYLYNGSWFSPPSHYYNSGNCAIAEAGYAKAKGRSIWTIALDAGTQGGQVLSEIADDGQAYTGSPADLNTIFSEIAGKINAAMQDASVSDPMGAGFQVDGDVSDLITVPASPAATYDPVTKTISWDPGTLTTPIEEGSDIKYAELKYRIEINDDILSQTPDANGEYPTNGNAQVLYKDIDGNDQTALFPVPRVNPVFLTVEKELYNAKGEKITTGDDRDFTVNVTETNPVPGSEPYNHDYVVKAGEKKVTTNLRLATSYTVSETHTTPDVAGIYDTSIKISGAETGSFTVNNQNDPDVEVVVTNKEKPIDIKVNKNWVGPKKDSVTIQLLADDTQIDSVLLNEGNGWQHTFSKLPYFNYSGNGAKIKYTLNEISIPDYFTQISDIVEDTIEGVLVGSFTVTNTNTETVDVSVTKVWVGPAGTEVLVGILADGVAVEDKSVTLNTDNSWTDTFTGLPKYNADGTEIAYTVTENEVSGVDPDKYNTVVSGSMANGFTITNTNTETVSVSVTKVWVGPAGTAVTVGLLADGTVVADESVTLNADNSWTDTFTGLPKYNADGTEISYTVTENEVSGVDASKYNTVVSGSMAAGFTITNTNKETVDVSVTKVWVGPAGTAVTVGLLADGTVVAGESVTLNADNSWTDTFTGLPKYNADGTAIAYTVTENEVSGVDASKYNTVVTGSMANGFTITNTNTETVSVSVTKVWVGPAGTDVTVGLLADGVEVTGKSVTLNTDNSWTDTFTGLPKYNADGTEISYTVTENEVSGVDASKYNTVVSGSMAAGFTITNTNKETVDVSVTKIWVGPAGTDVTVGLLADGTVVAGESVTLNADNSWTDTFTGLPKYNADGTAIAYTVTENEVSGVDASKYNTVVTGSAANGFTITNTNTETVSVPVTKVWVGPAGTAVTVGLLADGTVVAGESVTLNADNSWTDTFTGLPKYNADGTEIAYTVTENEVSGVDPDKYNTVVSGSMANGFTITNTNTETVSVSVTKVWVGPAGTDVTVGLLADGTVVAGESVTLNADNSWTDTFTELPKYNADGTEIVYSVTENEVSGVDASKYNTVISGSAANGFTITNTNTETVSVPVTKVWVGPAGTEVLVGILADGVAVEDKSVTLNADNNWTDTFTGLPKYNADGTEISYTVTENEVSGVDASKYNTVVSGSMAAGFTITNTNKETVDVDVDKVWVGPAGTAVTIKLLADGVEVAGKEVILNADNNWSGTFSELPKYTASGAEIVYTVAEVSIEGYTSNITGSAAEGFTVTNRNDAKTSVDVQKVWIGPAAESVTVNLLADGTQIDSVVLNEANEWKHTFTDLRKYDADDGELIEYTVTEDAVTGYSTGIEEDEEGGFIITNTNDTKTSVDVEKVWVGPAAESVTVNLLADGTQIDSVVLNEANEWKHTFTDLRKYDADDGELIEYTVTEDAVTGYSTGIEEDEEGGFIITNTNDAKISVDVEKVWIGPAAESVTVNLLADGTQIDSVVLNEANEWKHTFTDLRKYDADDGEEIVYTLAEVTIDDYTSDITGSAAAGFTITNTNTETVAVSVKKVWDGPKGDAVTVGILADGTLVADESITLNADNNWADAFTEMPKYNADGTEIAYTVTENEVSGVDPDKYNTVVSGSMAAGFIITNTNTERIDVTVEKEWVGKADKSATINLIADGKEVDSVKLTKDNNWQHTFADLRKYDSEGNEIKYTIEEKSIKDYKITIRGSAGTGFTVTNTYKEPDPIPVPEDPKKPKTGDDNQIWLWVMIAGLSSAGAGVMFKKRRNSFK